MKIIQSKSADETKKFAKNLAKDFLGGGIIALSGELGAGKTTFAQGFAQGLNIKERIISPTFLIVRQYKIPGQTNFFYHIDLYRLENIDPIKTGVDLKNLGIAEILDDKTNVVLIEWADKISAHLPTSAKRIKLRKISEDLHEIELTNF